MVRNCLCYGVFLIAISLPLCGCMDIKAPGSEPAQQCGGYAPNGVDFIGYSCPPTPGYSGPAP